MRFPALFGRRSVTTSDMDTAWMELESTIDVRQPIRTGRPRAASLQSQDASVPVMEVLREALSIDGARRQDKHLERLKQKKENAEKECQPLTALTKEKLERYMIINSKITNALAEVVGSKARAAHKRVKSVARADMRIDALVLFGHQTAQARMEATVAELLVDCKQGETPNEYANFGAGGPQQKADYAATFRSLVLHKATHDYAGRTVSAFPSVERPSLEASVLDIARWLRLAGMDYSSIYWLWHQRHDGRENVLRYVANRCGLWNKLASSFFCSRISARELRSGFVPTLASELVRFMDGFQPNLMLACNRTGDWIFQKSILTQMAHLFVGPFARVPERHKRFPLLIIIDSLDECDDESFHQIILAIVNCVEEIPNIYFILSCKEDPRMTGWFAKGWPLRSRTTVGYYA